MLAATLGLGAMATSAASFAAEQNWRFANLYGRGTAYGQVYEDLAKNIETIHNQRLLQYEKINIKSYC